MHGEPGAGDEHQLANVSDRISEHGATILHVSEQGPVSSDTRTARNAALEEAVRAVEAMRMPKGEGPLMLIEVKAEIAKAIRRLKR